MEEPLRYHRTFGLNAEQLEELEARIEDILSEPWDKGIGRPKSLSLREAIMVTLLYKRQNMIEEVIADLFGVSQGTVSEIIAEFTPLIAQATEEFRPVLQSGFSFRPSYCCPWCSCWSGRGGANTLNLKLQRCKMLACREQDNRPARTRAA